MTRARRRLPPGYFAFDSTADVRRGPDDRDMHLHVFGSRANVTRWTKAHGDVTDRHVGLRTARTGLKEHTYRFDVSGERTQR